MGEITNNHKCKQISQAKESRMLYVDTPDPRCWSRALQPSRAACAQGPPPNVQGGRGKERVTSQ